MVHWGTLDFQFAPMSLLQIDMLYIYLYSDGSLVVHWVHQCQFTGSPGAPVHWFTGSPGAPVHWFTGSPGALDHWCSGALVHWCTGSPGSLVHWFTGALVHLVHLLVPWFTGF